MIAVKEWLVGSFSISTIVMDLNIHKKWLILSMYGPNDYRQKGLISGGNWILPSLVGRGLGV